MPSGVYKRTKQHLKILRKGIKYVQQIAEKSPKKRQAALENLKKAQAAARRSSKRNKYWKVARRLLSERGQTVKQLKASRRNIRKAQRAVKYKGMKHRGWRASQEARKHKDGRCDICKKRCKIQKDHCHKTDKKRGKLCFNCNVGLGSFRDSRSLLKKAIRYLKKWE